MDPGALDEDIRSLLDDEGLSELLTLLLLITDSYFFAVYYLSIDVKHRFKNIYAPDCQLSRFLL